MERNFIRTKEELDKVIEKIKTQGLIPYPEPSFNYKHPAFSFDPVWTWGFKDPMQKQSSVGVIAIHYCPKDKDWIEKEIIFFINSNK